METQWTEGQLAWFKAEWERKVHGPVRLMTPLPRRVRFRLAVRGRVDGLAIWLAGHGHLNAARVTWQVLGGWR